VTCCTCVLCWCAFRVFVTGRPYVGAGRACARFFVCVGVVCMPLGHVQVTMLQSTFKEHGLANSSAPSTGGSVAPIPVKGLVRKVSSALDRMTPAGRRPSTTPGAAGAAGAASTPAASSSSFFKPSTVTYVNSLAVTVTVNDSNDRVALLLAGRFMPDPKKDDFHGRLVDKTAVRLPSPWCTRSEETYRVRKCTRCGGTHCSHCALCMTLVTARVACAPPPPASSLPFKAPPPPPSAVCVSLAPLPVPHGHEGGRGETGRGKLFCSRS
jgi:hypothetical protein